jgi:hypothetical protein
MFRLLVGTLSLLLLLPASLLALPSPASVASVFGTDQVFGVVSSPHSPRSTASSLLMSLRGGAVLVPDNLQELEAILMRAGSEGKLVVIDFTATWYELG